ncbi:hypothetical protein MNBD_GAMMA08-1456 [hydrothermal vent metagenome]|uniref:QbdB n=1 Tax=hydrothermal vent metagenome TaxID=652676 RepID=A0A3B0XV32_9ZZZZ
MQKKKMIRQHLQYSASILLICFCIAPRLLAQALEPRAYANAPAGLNFVVAGYQGSRGGLIFDPAIPINDATSTVDVAVFGYLRTLNVAGLSAKAGIVLPYADLYAEGRDAQTNALLTREVSGAADPSLYFSINFYGAPALNLREFKNYKQDTIAGFTLKVTPPLGQYARDKIINIGTNRWSIKPELGISKAINRWILEATTNVTFYTNNDQFATNKTRKQAAVYSLQGNLIYTFQNKIWLSYGFTYFTGGETKVNGVVSNDLQNNSRTGFTAAIPINKYHSIKILASTGVSTRTGSDYDSINIFWQYRWGAGL